MSALNELEAWQDGLTSPFWTVFSRYITQEWGPSGLAYQQAVESAATKPDGMIELQKVLHTSRAMRALLEYPASRVNQLKSQGLKELVEIRSRGGA